jgi:hypothetical protein
MRKGMGKGKVVKKADDSMICCNGIPKAKMDAIKDGIVQNICGV